MCAAGGEQLWEGAPPRGCLLWLGLLDVHVGDLEDVPGLIPRQKLLKLELSGHGESSVRLFILETSNPNTARLAGLPGCRVPAGCGTGCSQLLRLWPLWPLHWLNISVTPSQMAGTCRQRGLLSLHVSAKALAKEGR